MLNFNRQTIMGIGAILAALFLILIAIPNWVSSPSNVSNIVLSPVFWPNALAGMTLLVGIGLVLTGQMSSAMAPADNAEMPGGYGRLGIVAVIMVIYMFGLPRLGMVWTSMLVFAAISFLVHTSHPKTALISALVVPLVLYAFFAHVAGVAIPQGQIVRLP